VTANANLTLAWATDIHLDHVDPGTARAFVRAVRASGATQLLLGGDITVAEDLAATLVAIAEAAGMPVRFVLGNHDYYGGGIAAVRARVARLDHAGLVWLPASGPVELSPAVTLVGHGGWGDARIGDFSRSDVILNDYVHIEELHRVFDESAWEGTYGPDSELERELNRLGDEAAASLAPHLESAAAAGGLVIVLTHVPPFREASRYEDADSGEAFLPHYCCGAVGEVLVKAADENPACRFHVLCGHTHGEGEVAIRPNLVVTTQGARYGNPGYRLVTIREGAAVVAPPDFL
jgi:predicted phosphohydrolase